MAGLPPSCMTQIATWPYMLSFYGQRICVPALLVSGHTLTMHIEPVPMYTPLSNIRDPNNYFVIALNITLQTLSHDMILSYDTVYTVPRCHTTRQ